MTERRVRRRPGENRERLLEAGLIEFGLFGYHGASTAAIARRADVPQPHLYASFQNKRELFLACFAIARDEARDRGADANADRRRLILQAFAAVNESALHAVLSDDLRLLRTGLGETEFSALLAAAARSLSDADSDHAGDDIGDVPPPLDSSQ